MMISAEHTVFPTLHAEQLHDLAKLTNLASESLKVRAKILLLIFHNFFF